MTTSHQVVYAIRRLVKWEYEVEELFASLDDANARMLYLEFEHFIEHIGDEELALELGMSHFVDAPNLEAALFEAWKSDEACRERVLEQNGAPFDVEHYALYPKGVDVKSILS